MTKAEMRKQLIKKRLHLAPALVYSKSLKITGNLLNRGLLKGSQKILIYLPVGNEVDTNVLLQKLVKDGKMLFLPSYKNKGWVVSKYNPAQPLAKAFGDVMQPQKVKFFDSGNLDAAIVPGVAFSKNGVRLGFGLGVYDKLLADSSAVKIGLCYDFQVIDSLVPESHDVKMNYVVSEDEIFKAI